MTTYEEYLRKHEELTRQEQQNKRDHTEIMAGLEKKNRENVAKEADLFHELKEKERKDYLEKQYALGAEKRELKIKFKLEMEASRAEQIEDFEDLVNGKDTNAARIARQMGM